MPFRQHLIRFMITAALAVGLFFACGTNTGPLGPLYVVSMTPANLSGIADTVKARYWEDAAILTSRILVQRPGDRPAQLNPELQESLFHGLMHIYRAYHLPERDSIVAHHFIHAWPLPTVRELRVTFDPEAPWAASWAANSPLSGHQTMDNLATQYGISIHIYYLWSPHHAVVLRTDAPYHMPTVAGQFKQVDGIITAEPEQRAVAGSNITAVAGFNHWTFYFQYRGTALNRIWAFRVDNSGDVKFLGGQSP